MLTNLHVRNLALIDEADIDFKEGLNILTGETGAGKSIILGSVNIALGGKTSFDIIRKGTEYALTELLFNVTDENVINQLKQMGVEDIEDGEILVSRKITPTRSQCKINGQNITASQIRQISSLLIDIHGQHDNQMLLNDSCHLKIIDDYAKEELSQLKSELKIAFDEYSSIKKELMSLDMDEETRNREISFAEFEVSEIESAKLLEDEDIELEKCFRKMSHSQKIIEELSLADQLISSDNDGICDKFGIAARAVNNVSSYDSSVQQISDSMNDLENLLSDISRSINDYIEECSYDETEFNNIQNRLDLINSLKMKYGKTIDDIIQYCNSKKEKLQKLYDFTKIYDELKEKLLQKENILLDLSEQLSCKRKEISKILCSKICDSLKELNFKDVKFDVEFQKNSSFSENGLDTVSFLISTNPGEDLKKLSKIASGGELSRVMLAIKAVTASNDNIETLIFDEIDAGISGRTAQKVAEKLCSLSQNSQILCITHLPQIAAMADSHFVIEKNFDNNITKTEIRELPKQEINIELARLLGGSVITDTVIANAEEMRDFASGLKNYLKKPN